MQSQDFTLPRVAPASALRQPLPSWVRPVVDVTGLSCIALFLIGFVYRNVPHQGDFLAYWYAGHAALLGIDPYPPEHLSALAGRPMFPFLYPPIALLPFTAIASAPLKIVALTWIWAKIALLGAMAVVWSKWFNRHPMVLPSALIAAFGWNSSAQWSLASGNIAIPEAALVWAALACYVVARRWAFAALIVTAACFKLAPAAFLLLLLVPTEGSRSRPGLFVGSCVVLALLLVGPMLVGPAARFGHFWQRVPNWTTHGMENPAMLGLLTTWASRVRWAGAPVPGLGLLLWGVYACALLGMSTPFLKRCQGAQDARQWSMAAAFLYVLLNPRPMAYGYAILTPAPLFFSPKPFDGPVGRWLLTIALIAQGLLRATYHISRSPVAYYAPLLLTLCVWFLVLNDANIRGTPGGQMVCGEGTGKEARPLLEGAGGS